MLVTINKITYYRTVEVCKLVGIGRTTLLRWTSGGHRQHPAKQG